MENYNKIAMGVITAVIIGFLSASFALFNEVQTSKSEISNLKLRADYIEKKMEESITVDKLENAKLQLSQQVAVHCR